MRFALTGGSIARKLVVALILFSSMITLVTTAIQIALDYQGELRVIEGNFDEIQSTNLESISQAVWVLDDRQIEAQLTGLLHKADIKHLSILVENRTRWVVGEEHIPYEVRREFPIEFQRRGVLTPIGTLVVKASLSGVYARLLSKILVILFGNLVKTSLVAIFLFVVIHRILTRHLFKLGEFAHNLGKDLNSPPITLERSTLPDSNPDELEQVANALRDMQRDLRLSYQELKKSQIYQHLLLESTFVAFYGLDGEGRCIFANRACAEVLGYGSPVQLIGRNIHELAHHSHRDGTPYAAAQCQINQAHRTGEKIFLPSEILWRKDGAPLEVDLWSYPILEDGRLTGAVVTFVDVGEKRKAEEDLRASEERFRATFENAGLGMVLTGRDGKWLQANQAFHEMLGYSHQEIMDLTYEQVTHPDDLEGDRKAFLELVAGNVPAYTREKRYVRKDGSTLWANLTAASIKDKAGNPEIFVLMVEDIEGRKTAELALRESEERLRSFMDSAPDIMTIFDKDLNLILTNPKGAERFGFPMEQIIGKNLGDISSQIVEAGRLEVYRHVINTGIPTQMEAVVENPGMGTRNLEIRAFPVGAGLGLISTDITEKTQAETAKGEFISTLSHELRTPLTSIIGAVGIVLGMYGEELTPQAIDMMNMAQRNLDHLLQMVNDLLDIQKIESGKLDLAPKPIDLGELLTNAVEVNQGFADKYEVSLRTSNLPIGAMVLGDWGRLTQVVSNLISNAVKFSWSGSSVEISAELRHGLVRVLVTDQGMGIPETFRSQIFEKFSQVDSSDTRKVEGTGLGLSICKSIVDSHGGVLDFTSIEKVGSTFFFDLPVMQDTPLDKKAG